MAALSRKEYLKRYMSGSNDKKKKKKAEKPVQPTRCKIVDDDVDLTDLPVNPEDAHEPERGEDAPLVAEVIDERPAELRVEEEYRKNAKWKTFGSDSEDNSNVDDDNRIKKDAFSGGHDSGSDKSLPRQRHDSDSDQSPRRIQRHDSDSDQSPDRVQRHDSDSNPSQPSRMRKPDDQLPRRNERNNSGSDQSPPRRRQYDSGSDQSPPRKKIDTFNNHSPPRRKRHNSDQSPPRKTSYRADQSLHKKRTANPDSDQSPPRREGARGDSGHSPPRKDKGLRRKDQSPPRKGKTRWGSSHSPPSSNSKRDVPSTSPARTTKGDNRSHDEKRRPEKMLEGKRAGLQDGKTLRKENEDFRRREKDAFKNINDELSGRTAATIIRDRSTGRKRNLKAEHLLQKAEDAKKVEREEKYMQWGKGLKQQEMQEGRLANDLYEMTKPLARYKDDVDLDRELRQQDRDGDPMLEFIKKKKAASSDPNKPVYRGPPPPPNRFGIPPGYRWDGVDRSNGFEAERIARAADKKASLEDAYKWSVECM